MGVTLEGRTGNQKCRNFSCPGWQGSVSNDARLSGHCLFKKVVSQWTGGYHPIEREALMRTYYVCFQEGLRAHQFLSGNGSLVELGFQTWIGSP